MFYLAVPMATQTFYEDVVAWLDRSEIRYTKVDPFDGTSGTDFLVGYGAVPIS